MVDDQDDSCDEGRLELQVEEGERLSQDSLKPSVATISSM